MAERFAVYRYEITRQDGPSETRYSFEPVKPGGYAGNDEPSNAHPFGNEPAEAGQMRPAGDVEAPDGSRIVSMEPPILEIPDRGNVDVLTIIQEGRGAAPELGHLVHWRPA